MKNTNVIKMSKKIMEALLFETEEDVIKTLKTVLENLNALYGTKIFTLSIRDRS